MGIECKCSVCGQAIEPDLLVYMDHTEKHIMDEIRSNHPDWVEKDGLCKKCVDYYRQQIKGDSPAEGS